MIYLIALAVFVAAIAFDYADAQNKIAIEQRNGHRAGCWSVAMYCIGVAGTLALVKVSVWLVLPECAGLYIGSRLAIRKAKPSADLRNS